MDSNLGWLFYRALYARGEDGAHIEKTMQRLLRANGKEEGVKSAHGFELKTLYPGLLVGSGYAHGISSEHDAKIGFFFDHTSGLPVIPGSSVKGVLRSLFGLPSGDNKEAYRDAKQAMIRELLGVGEDFDVYALAEAIFEGVLGGKRLGTYRRDRFYDARAVKTSCRLLADDYITPHADPLKNPVPIRFVKVPGGVTFAFAFELVDTTVGSVTVSAEQKELLFLQLLQEFGIGAKTSVGYGQFETVDVEALARQRALRREAEAAERREAEAQREKAEALAEMSPLERKAAELAAEDPNARPTTLLLKAIASGMFDDEKCEALALLKRMMAEANEWREVSKKKNQAKDKLHKNTLEVLTMLENCR